MKSSLKLLPTLCLTIIMSGLAPVMLCGLILALCSVLLFLPGISSCFLSEGLTSFLEVFGSGNAWSGISIIAVTCGFVGGLFETFNFYYYQNPN